MKRIGVFAFFYIAILGMAFGYYMHLKEWDVNELEIAVFAVIFVVLLLIVVTIFQYYIDRQTERYGEDCYARVMNTRIFKDRNSTYVEIKLSIYRASLNKPIDFKETKTPEEVAKCKLGDYILVKYHKDDINTDYVAVEPRFVPDEIRRALGENLKVSKNDTGDNEYEYLNEMDDDQSIVPEEGYGYELGNEKELETNTYIAKEDAKFARMQRQLEDEESERKRLVNNVVAVVIFATIVVIFIFGLFSNF